MICCRCSNRLKSAYDFITQAQDVNDKYMKLLTSDDDPLGQSGGKSGDLLSDCLEESTIDIPLSQYIPDVKLEEGHADQFNVILEHKLAEGQSAEQREGTVVNHDFSCGVVKVFCF